MNTITNATVTMLAAALVIGITAGKANAQVTGRLGLNALMSQTAIDISRERDLTFGIGIETKGKALIGGYRGKGSIDIDYKQNAGQGNQISCISLAYTERYALMATEPGSKRITPYVGLGVGVGYTNLRMTSFILEPVSVQSGLISRESAIADTSDYNTSFAGKAILGLNLSDRLSLEGAYCYSPKVDGVRTDSYSVSVGLRF